MASTQTKTPEPAPLVRSIAAQPKTLQRKDFIATDYWLTVEDGHQFDDLLNPDYYAHIARKLRTNTMIYVNAADGRFFAMLRVTSSGDAWAKVQVILKTEEAVEVGDPTPERGIYKIDHTQEGWRVIHRDTAKVIVAKLGTRVDAERFIDETVAAKSKQ